MSDWEFIFLGILQGLTEFLPLSSSGHLFLLNQLLQGEKSSLSFVLLLHGATFLSVCLVFRKELKDFIFSISKKKNLQLFYKILVSLAPVFVVGLFLKPLVEQSFNKYFVAVGFFSSSLLLFSLFFYKNKKAISLEQMSFQLAFLIGLAQCLAVFPGFSRSAWTIVVGLFSGLKPKQAVYYSFLISLPVIVGSLIIDWLNPLFKSSATELSHFNISFLPLLGSFFLAFFVGLMSLLLVLKMVQAEKFYVFSFYLLPLSLWTLFFL